MDYRELLPNLKADLQISTSAYDSYLTNLLKVAESAIKTRGIKLDDTFFEDIMLVVMYAGYLYRNRKDPSYEMPKSLRSILNDKLFSQKAGG